MPTLLDIIFPKSCTICSKHGEYLCDKCRRLFKKSIPECYVCRRISGGYITHEKCLGKYSLDSMAVLWEYNKLSSGLLKKYKYGLATDIEKSIEDLLLKRLAEIESSVQKKNTLCIPVPISNTRLRERGFNQVEGIGMCVADFLDVNFSKDIVFRRDGNDVHQSLLDKDERFENRIGFFVNNFDLLENINEVVIVDDVVTTGSTIEQVCRVIKEFNSNIIVRGICLFRGRPYYIKKEGDKD